MITPFLNHIAIEKRYSQRTVDAYQDDLEEFCRFLQVSPYTTKHLAEAHPKYSASTTEAHPNTQAADLPLFDPLLVTDDDIRMWLVDMMDRGQKPRSVRRKLSTLHSFWRFLLQTGQVTVDITRRIIAPKMEKSLPIFFKPEEMASAEELMHYADDFVGIRDNLIIEMLYETGMRRAEIVGLTDADVDLVQMQVRIFGKRRKARIVPFGDKLSQMITQYLEARANQFADTTDFPTLLLNTKGLPLSTNTLYKIVRARMGEVSSLKKHSPHVLRHTFATSMLNNGADIRTIQALLGHASVATTEIYAHTSFEQVKKVYSQAHPRNKK